MSSWNDEYYDIIDFYYWEPQHLGKKKYDNSKYANVLEVISHLRKIEVPLNHIFNIFFRLAPNDFTLKLLSHCYGISIKDEFDFQGNKEWKEYVPNELTQPDIFLSGKNTNFAVELKVGSKSTLEQVAKYLILNRLNNSHFGTDKKFFLLYLSPVKFNRLWKQDFSTTAELKQEFKSREFRSLRKKAKHVTSLDFESALESIDSTQLCSITYSELLHFTTAYRNSIDTDIPFSETVISLCSGLIKELSYRGYGY
jgi:hypothetical protein